MTYISGVENYVAEENIYGNDDDAIDSNHRSNGDGNNNDGNDNDDGNDRHQEELHLEPPLCLL